MRLRMYLWNSVSIFLQLIPSNWCEKIAKILHDQDLGKSLLQSLGPKSSALVAKMCENCLAGEEWYLVRLLVQLCLCN